MLNPVQQNSANHPLPIRLVSSTDHVTAVTGATVTVMVSKDGAASWSAASGTVTEVGNGLYWFNGNSTDRNTLGRCLYKASATGADDFIGEFTVYAYDPWNVLPTGNAGGANGLLKLDGTGTAITLTIDGDLDGTVTGNVVGDVQGKLLGGGIGTPTAVGAWVADGSGNPVGTAANQTTLLTRVSAARAGYLDNLNVGGAVASHADIAALNASASRTMTLACVAQMEPGETYTVEMHTYNRATGASSNADSTPTLTAVGAVSGSLAANLTGPTNPSTAIYQWTYTVPATPTLEQIRFAGSATVAGFADSLACYTQTVDEATVVFTATDQTHLTSIFNKLPAGSIGDATATTQTAIKAKTDLIATNAADSPEVVTTVGTISTLLTRITGPVMLAASYVAPDNADIAAIVAVTNKVNTMLATSGLNWAYTVDALKNGPQGSGGGGTSRTINEVQRIIFEKQS